ncbi:MAG: hypothetical protein E7281_00045 [Lachnospiraceae bacterium]|nr:hypothetical protein [Lachnospiraceae bacterium]
MKRTKLIFLFIMILAVLVIIASIFVKKRMVDYTERDEKGFCGYGTEDNPYLIETVDDLIRFRDAVNNGESFGYTYFKQVNDLDLGNIDNWIPIGIYGTDRYFCGYYDGAGHTISNLNCTYDMSEIGNVGLFGILAGSVQNLGIESGNVVGYCVGAIASAGTVNAKIINCYNKASLSGYRAGGISDYFRGSIFFCVNMGEITGTNYAAGIVSYDCKKILNCYSVGEMPLVTSNFVGDIDKSEVIKNVDYKFINRYNKNLIKWGDKNDEYSNLQNMILSNGNIRYKMNNEKGFIDIIISKVSLWIVLFVSLGFIILVDYNYNIMRCRYE